MQNIETYDELFKQETDKMFSFRGVHCKIIYVRNDRTILLSVINDNDTYDEFFLLDKNTAFSVISKSKKKKLTTDAFYSYIDIVALQRL